MPAEAQSWTVTQIYSDTASEFAKGVSLRNWGPTGEVFFALELKNSSDETHLEILGYECDNSDCTASTLQFGPDDLGRDILYGLTALPSLAITRSNSTAPRELSLVHRFKVRKDCDADGIDYGETGALFDEQNTLDLIEEQWDTTNGHTTDTIAHRVHTTRGFGGHCDDQGASFTRIDASGPDTLTCWRENKEDGIIPQYEDQVICGKSPGRNDQTWPAAEKDVLSNTIGAGEVTQDHPWFTMVAGDRIVAHRSQEGPGDRTRLRFVDDPALTSLNLFWDGDDGDYPSIQYVANQDRLHLAWQTGRTLLDDHQIMYTTCEFQTGPPLVDCTISTDWADPENVNDAVGATHNVNLAADGKRVFIAYTEDIDSGGGENYQRVQVKTQCFGDDDWINVTASAPRPQTTADTSQSMFSGRPSMVLNRKDNVVHVAFAELDEFGSGAIAGDVYWASAPYSSCP